MSVEAVIEQALKLTADEREEVIERLRVANAREAPTDPAWEAGWSAEIDRRIADIREGQVKLMEADEAFARLRAAASRHR